MQEEYLHYLWRMKRLNFNQLKLTDGSTVSVSQVGWYNLDAGPDFFNGTVAINGIQWSGNIELHVKSSDWYLHKHHLDQAYDNVILHVVYEHDKEVLVKDVPLPTIELKSQIDLSHFRNYQRIISTARKVPCSDVVMHNKLALLQQIDVLFLHRIERKGLELIELMNVEKRGQNEILLAAIFKAIGGRVNKLPMQELACIIPYQLVLKERWDTTRLESLFFGAAGLLNDQMEDHYFLKLQSLWKLLKHKHGLPEMNASSWKFNGIRPHSFPTILIAQVVALLSYFEFHNLSALTSLELIEKIKHLPDSTINAYWKTHYVFGKKAKPRKLGFSRLFKQNLLINGFVPYFITLKHLRNDFGFSDKIIDLMEELPPETNNVVKYWENIGFRPKNALESQGLLELNNEFCNFKKCLSCKVGMANLEK